MQHMPYATICLNIHLKFRFAAILRAISQRNTLFCHYSLLVTLNNTLSFVHETIVPINLVKLTKISNKMEMLIAGVQNQKKGFIYNKYHLTTIFFQL